MTDLKLYNYFRSSPSYRVRIALHLKGLEFKYAPIHLLNNGGEQNSEEYQKINPSREVPSLEHEGALIGQSVAIIEYLDEAFPTPALYPKELHSRSRVRQLCEIINCTHPLQNLKVLQYLENDLGINADQKAKWLSEWMHRGFHAYEEIIRHTSGAFSVGDHITAADLFLIPQIFSAQRFNVSISQYRQISRIEKTCLSLDVFKKAHPYNQIDTPNELRLS